MLQALCAIAAACTVAGQPAGVVRPTSALQSPPRLVEIQQQTVTTPRHRRAPRTPRIYLYQRNLGPNEGCEQYNCIGPRTDFRLPNEIPYPKYEQQFTGRPSAK